MVVVDSVAQLDASSVGKLRSRRKRLCFTFLSSAPYCSHFQILPIFQYAMDPLRLPPFSRTIISTRVYTEKIKTTSETGNENRKKEITYLMIRYSKTSNMLTLDIKKNRKVDIFDKHSVFENITQSADSQMWPNEKTHSSMSHNKSGISISRLTSGQVLIKSIANENRISHR